MIWGFLRCTSAHCADCSGCVWLFEIQGLSGGDIIPPYRYSFHLDIWAKLSNTEEDGKALQQHFWKDSLHRSPATTFLLLPQLKFYILTKTKYGHDTTNYKTEIQEYICGILLVVPNGISHREHFSCVKKAQDKITSSRQTLEYFLLHLTWDCSLILNILIWKKQTSVDFFTHQYNYSYCS